MTLLPGSSGLSTFMELLLKSEFPQFDLLEPDAFSRFLRDRKIDVSIEELEYYDKKGVIRPVLRLDRKRATAGFPAHGALLLGPHRMKEYYNDGLVELPKDDDYVPWKTYRNGYKEDTLLFYHRSQFVQVRRLVLSGDVHLNARYIEEVDDITDKYQKWKKDSARSIQTSTEASIESWIPRTGLLMLIENVYSPFFRGIHFDFFHDVREHTKSWLKWKKDFSPKSILDNSGLTLDDAKKLHEILAREGDVIDPLSNFYVLIELARASRKKSLKGEALLARDYYDLAKMVSKFIFELTNGEEKMPDPDDVMDQFNGSWKLNAFGSPFDYSRIRTQRAILEHYLTVPQYSIALVYEGKTEHTVIRKISNTLPFSLDQLGVITHNAKGGTNISTSNLDGLITITKKQGMDVYVIIDNDEKSKKIVKEQQKRGNIGPNAVHIWDKDFEYDNFGTTDVVNWVNTTLVKKGYKPVSKDEVEKEMSMNGVVLMRAIESLAIRDNPGINFDKVIRKPEMAKYLIAPHIARIKNDIQEQGRWKPRLPIEIVLDNFLSGMRKTI